jgi:hypothetical protein
MLANATASVFAAIPDISAIGRIRGSNPPVFRAMNGQESSFTHP